MNQFQNFPGDPKIADIVLSAMTESKGDSVEIARITRLPHNQVRSCMEMLRSTYPSMFQGSKGGYGDGVDIFLNYAAIPVFKHLLENGGLSAIAQSITDRQFMEAQREVKQDELLDLDLYIRRDEAMVGINRAEARAKRSEWAAWIAVLIALFALFFNK